MDDFGNIIYILAAIGWFFWNAYNKSQVGKRKPSTTNGPKPENQASGDDKTFKSLEDLILDQIGGNEEKESQPVRVDTVSNQSRRYRNEDKFLNLDLTHSHLTDDYQMSVSEGGSHRVKRQVERLKVREVEEDGSLMDNLFPNEGFDLRKAVVLHSILDRPYR